MTQLRLTPSSREVPKELGSDGFARELARAAQAWTGGCAGLDIVVEPPRDLWSAQDDGVDLVAFRSEAWCKNFSCGTRQTYPMNAFAMTTVYPEGAVGRPTGGDVELNSHYFSFSGAGPTGKRWSTAASSPMGWEVSLQAVLVHEVGHLLGLADSCQVDHAHGMRPSAECAPGHGVSAMHAPNGLLTPSPSELAIVCALWSDAEPPIERAPVRAVSERDPWMAAAAIAIGLLFVAALSLVRARRSRYLC